MCAMEHPDELDCRLSMVSILGFFDGSRLQILQAQHLQARAAGRLSDVPQLTSGHLD